MSFKGEDQGKLVKLSSNHFLTATINYGEKNQLKLKQV